MSLEQFLSTETNLDKTCLEVTSKNANMLVPWYLMAAYAYYVKDDSIISDSVFDGLAKSMLDHWNTIEHYHKHLITKEQLEAGTYLGEYPSIIEGAIEEVRAMYG